jgi:predicted RNase H-like HicB family nuclease
MVVSVESTVRVTETRKGVYRAVDDQTGATAEGSSKTEALATLTDVLRQLEEARVADSQPQAPPTSDEYDALRKRVQARTEDSDLTEADIEAAIEWARRE